MSSHRPLVSVVLPTYNRAHTLRRAIDSVLAQTYDHLELLVVDDGSTDDTPALLASYNDPRLRPISGGRRAGAGAARNLGIAAARGEYIAFQDSDDAWLLEKLERQVACLAAHPDKAVCVAGYFDIRPGEDTAGYCGAVLMKRDMDFLTLFRYGYQFSTPAWLVRKSFLDRVGVFDESLRTWEDWELSIRLDAAGGFVHLDEPLHLQFESSGSVKLNIGAYAPTLLRVMEKHAQYLSPSRKVRSRHEWLMYTWERGVERRLSARGHLLKALRIDPLNLRAWATFAKRFPELFLSARGATDAAAS